MTMTDNKEQVEKMKASTEGWKGPEDLIVTIRQSDLIEDILKNFDWEAVMRHLNSFNGGLDVELTFSELREQAKLELYYAADSEDEHYIGQSDGFFGGDCFRVCRSGDVLDLSFVLTSKSEHLNNAKPATHGFS